MCGIDHYAAAIPNVQWREPAIDDDERARFRELRAAAGIVHANAHDSYLINLASPDPFIWTRSLVSFTSELRRCEALGLDALVSHPGNYIDDRDEGLARNVAGINLALATVPGRTRLLMEMTAGSGTALGSTFEEMAHIVGAIDPLHRARVGVCVDTAHVFAAGYDLVDDFDGVWSRFDETIGLERLGMLHLNDSRVPRGSKRDRHELIGEGMIGTEPFRRVMTDVRFVRVPKVIETPKLDDPEATDRRMLDRLMNFMVEGTESRVRRGRRT
jgi:deoxyribonuclease-4